MKRKAARAGSLLKTSLIANPPKAPFTSNNVCPTCWHRIANWTLFSSSSSYAGATNKTTSSNVATTQRRQQSSVAAAVKAAQTYLSNGKPNGPELPGGVDVDPFKSVSKEMKFLTNNIRQLVGSGHPVLDTVSKYYTQSEGKYIRPMLVLLMSQATALCPKQPSTGQFPSTEHHDTENIIDEPLSQRSILSDINPSMPSTSQSIDSDFQTHSNIQPTQRRLAEITELIHTASLLHDDVIDTSTTRRSSPSANIAFGNKMAVLAGDFLLGRASVALARLRNPEVTELLATVIANLIEGEFMQLRNTAADERNPIFRPDVPSASSADGITAGDGTVDYYLRKTYLKSASLISKSCRAAAILGSATPDVTDAAYAYGRNLGLAFQLVDDMLDFSAADAAQLGKPAGADLALGLATAPLLFAWRERPELGEMVGRKFAAEGDVQKARQLVMESDGIERTRDLAQMYADSAADAISGFPDSDAKQGLLEMCVKVMQRKK